MAMQPAPTIPTDGTTEPQSIAVESASARTPVIIPMSVSGLAAPTIGFPRRAFAGPIG